MKAFSEEIDLCRGGGPVFNIYKVAKSTSIKCIVLKKKKIRRSLREGHESKAIFEYRNIYIKYPKVIKDLV